MALSGAYRLVSLFLDIGQGTGLAGSSGVRPFLPPLLAGALARGDVGLDFDGTSYRFLESTWWLLLLLALAALSYALGRAGARRPAAARALDGALGGLGIVLGALLFGGSLADSGHPGWPGLLAGAACAALGYLGVGALLRGARRRLDAGAAGLLPVWADLAALALAGLAVLLPPLSFVAIAAFAWVLVAGRREQGKKYEGLRVLR